MFFNLAHIALSQLDAQRASKRAEAAADDARRAFEIERQKFGDHTCIDVEARVVPDVLQIEGDGFAAREGK